MKNLVWVTIDSLRADHVSAYGCNQLVTPNIDELARAGMRFDKCHSSGIKTPTAVASMLTATTPATHGFLGDPSDYKVPTLPAELKTVPERLGKAGYNTAGISRNAYFSDRTGLSRGFSEFTQFSNSVPEVISELSITEIPRYAYDALATRNTLSVRSSSYSTIPPVTRRARRTIRRFQREASPYCVFIHYNETHRPYDPPVDVAREYLPEADIAKATRKAREIDDELYRLIASNQTDDIDTGLIKSLYKAEIAHADRWIGLLLDEINLDDTIVVITGDHGEYLGEFGLFGHQLLPRDAVTHVPLVVGGINQELLSGSLVQHIDILTTILKINDIDFGQAQGIDLRHSSRDACFTEYHAGLDIFRRRVSEIDREPLYSGRVTSVRTGDYRYIEDDYREDLYRVGDPEIIDDEEITDVHQSLAAEYHRKYDLTPDGVQDRSEMYDRLNDLGYI